MLNNALLKAVWEQSRGWLFAIFVLLLLSLALFIYQTQFVTPELDGLQMRQAALQKQLKVRQAKLSESGVPVSIVEQMEKDLLTFSGLIPEKQKFADFIGDLFYWADNAKLDIKQISYQPKIDKEGKYLNYGLGFSVHGNYQQIKKFIHLLENSKRILIINKIGLSGKQNKNDTSAVSLNIGLTTFFQEDAR